MNTETENCEKHGEYQAVVYKLIGGRVTKSPCPHCVAEREAEELKRKAEEKELTRKRALEARIDGAAIPKRYKSARLTDFNPNAPEGPLKRFLGGDGWRVLLLVGPIGTGKTHLGAAIARHYCEERTALFTTSARMSEAIMRNRSPKPFTEVSLLVIDEVVRTYDTKAEENRFFEVVNERYNAELPLVLIGNVEADEYMKSVGAAVQRRLEENLTVIPLIEKFNG